MRITSLDLTAFRSFTNLTLDTNAKRIIIGGLNGTGKTSVREAIRWVLTGHCAVTDGRGVGSDRLSPIGSDHVAAALTIEHLGRVSRTRLNDGGVGTFSVEGLKGDASAQQQALFYKLQTQPDYLDAVLETEHFLRLDHVGAKALLLNLLDVKVTVGPTSYTLDELEVAYQTAYEDRKFKKKLLAASRVPEKPVGEFPPVAAIEEQLALRRKELTAAAGTEGEISGKRKAIEARIAAVTGLLKPEPDPLEVAAAADECGSLRSTIAILEAELAEELNRRDIDEALPTVAPKSGDPGRVMWLKQTIDQIQEHKPTKGCVLDRDVPCETHRNKFLARKTVLVAELAGLEGPSEPVPARAENASLAQLKAAQETLRAAEALRARYDAIVAHNATQQAQLTALQAELKAIPEPVAGDSNAVTALQLRIGKGEMLLRHATEYWRAQDAYLKASEAHAALKADVEQVEELVEALGPKGARVAALDAAIQRFETAINGITTAWGWQIAFSVDPWIVSANGRRVETYSESEQFRIGVAIQLAIAAVSGLSFAVVDRIDMLDQQNRRIVGEMLMQAPIEQVFMLSTREASVDLPPNLPGERIAYRFELHEGRTVATPAKVAA